MKSFHVLLIAALPLAAAEHLSLAEAVATAEKNQPRILAAAHRADAAQALPQQLRARLLPQLDATLTGSLAEHGTRMGVGGANAPDLFSRVGAGISLTQLFTDFGRTHLQIESARLLAGAQKDLTRWTAADVSLAARTAYYRALQAKAVLDVAKQVKGVRDTFARQIRSLAESDLRSTIDASFAELRSAEAEVVITRAENDLAASLVQLANAMGLDAPQDWELDPLPPAASSETLDQLIEEAVASRPELAMYRKRLESAKLDARSDQKLSMPTVSGVGVAGVIPTGDRRLRNHYDAAAINVTVPILNGRSFDARRQESTAKALAAEQDWKQTLLQVKMTLRLAYLDWMTARKNVEVNEKLRAQAETTLRMAETRYRVGLGAFMDFNQAQLDAASAQLAYSAALYEVSLRQVRLEYEAGRYGK
ncbi:TolC family protein [Bryobacter aggregatus]|uniref:TolC family protein n=1 Tax=Bryobacter aggregatus TaxID=360054 RepID=UPI0004E11296|nr:TolC family protein [Bryobacter aggregatus]